MGKHLKNWSFLLILSLYLVLSGTACSRKVGCPSNVATNVDLSDSGKGKKYKARSGLFPKSMERANP
jgi:hypothetical protein